jgi:hypothetical protein
MATGQGRGKPRREILPAAESEAVFGEDDAGKIRFTARLGKR